MRWRSLAVLAPLVWALTAGCAGSDDPHDSGEAGPTVFLGDSITAGGIDGRGRPPSAESWVGYALESPDVPWQLLDVAAVSGDPLEQMLLRYPTDVRAQEPNHLVVLGGTNDVLRKTPLGESRRALTEIVRLAQDDGITVWVVAPPPLDPGFGVDIGPMREMEREVAEELGAQWIDVTASVGEPDGTWRPGATRDGVHPTEQGARMLGTSIAEAAAGAAAG